MDIGDIAAVETADDIYYIDTGMYDTSAYGSVYIIDADQPAIVDTGIGTNYERIIDALASVDIEPDSLAHLLVTHAHLDHAGGAGFLIADCPNATVHTHERAGPHLSDPARLIEGTKAAVGNQWQYYVEPKPVPESRINTLSDGDTIDLGDRSITTVAAPGHALHQILFYDPTEGVLFTGDSAGIYVPKRDRIQQTSPPSQFNLETCLDDVRTIDAMAPETLCFGHFGPRVYDDELLSSYKRALVEWVEAVRQKRAEANSDEDVIQHFGNNAELTDVWGTEKARAESRLNVRGVLAYLDWQAAQTE
ncbi:MBL fold metallo-hydrolase [Haloquadratum walsbyi]|nr:MBL fold metallo-hydrolase [Haloquadratum walsbyi]